MNRIATLDNIIRKPQEYLYNILDNQFTDFNDGVNIFRGIQQRPNDDEFASFVVSLFGNNVNVAYNFVRRSPIGQIEPNFIHTDENMGDYTAILYLSESHPDEDGTTFYDDDESKMAVVYSKFNRMVLFDSKIKHSRNIFVNFGEGDKARLIQVLFLNEIK